MPYPLGVTRFDKLDDTFSYTGQAGKVPQVKSTEDGLEPVTPAAAIGTVLFSSGGHSISTYAAYYLRWGVPYYTSNETEATIRVGLSGTAKNLYFIIRTNTLSGPTVATVRKNGFDQAITLTIPAGATGDFADTVNTFSVAVGDKISVKFDTTASSSGSIIVDMFTLTIA